jgi:hypothetical protein
MRLLMRRSASCTAARTMPMMMGQIMGVGGGDHVPPPVTSEGDRRIGVALHRVEHVTTA